jgi:hypothetical protein
LIRAIVGRLVRLPLVALHEIAYPVSKWMERIEERLYGDAAEVLPALWDRLIKALNHVEPARWHRPDNSWADDALNAPVGRLFNFLLKDPANKNRKGSGGFPPHWLARLDQLLSLRGELRCQALVMISYQLNWLSAVDIPSGLSASSFPQPDRIRPTAMLFGTASCGRRASPTGSCLAILHRR